MLFNKKDTKVDKVVTQTFKKKSESDGETEFALNEGVPVENIEKKEKESTASKIFKPKVLTTASDPDWKFPPLNLLIQKQDKADAGNVQGNAEIIKDTLAHFKIDVEMEGANIGPRVTQYTLKPPVVIKLAKIVALESNIALRFSSFFYKDRSSYSRVKKQSALKSPIKRPLRLELVVYLTAQIGKTLNLIILLFVSVKI